MQLIPLVAAVEVLPPAVVVVVFLALLALELLAWLLLLLPVAVDCLYLFEPVKRLSFRLPVARLPLLDPWLLVVRLWLMVPLLAAGLLAFELLVLLSHLLPVAA